MKSLYEQARALFTPELMKRLEAYFGETPVMLERAVRTATSAVVGEAIDRASTEDGATDLLTQAQTAPTLALASHGDLREFIQQGQGVAAALLANRLGPAKDLVSSSSNVSPATASGLLAVGAPLVMALLGRIGHGSSATQFKEMLAGQRDRTVEAGPAGVTSVLEDGGLSWRHILPMILMGALLLLVPFLYKGCGEPAAVEITSGSRVIVPPVAAVPKPESISLPAGGTIMALPGSINYELAKFLASTAPAPKRFTFDHLNFEFNKTVITPESRPALADLVTILKAYPAVDVQLEGHTDSVGTPAENKKLSEERAAAIKTVLQADGIAARRISTAGYGEERPTASNATEEGRARNRRLELVVAKK